VKFAKNTEAKIPIVPRTSIISVAPIVETTKAANKVQKVQTASPEGSKLEYVE
jgi:hypothetical protein